MVAFPNAKEPFTFSFQQAVAAFFSVDGLPFTDVFRSSIIRPNEDRFIRG